MAAKNIVVVGAGLGGLTAAALLARAGHRVTVLEGNDWIGGKSRRIEVAGQRIDTGPSLVTFPGVLDELFDRYDDLGAAGAAGSARDIAGLRLERLPEVGRYFFRGTAANLPVEPGHEWHDAWTRFEAQHGGLGPAITRLLTADPFDAGILPAVTALTSRYGIRLSAQSFINGLRWMPEDLREIIAIHTLNAGISPARTLALYASMPAVMARDGIFVPTGGVYEIPVALARLATEAGATIVTGTQVTRIARGTVSTAVRDYPADVVVGATDAQVLNRLLGRRARAARRASCSGIAVFTALSDPLPDHVVTHSVIMPDSPRDLHRSLDRRELPEQTMAFLNYYKPGHIYPNDKATAAVLLTAPADGQHYTLDHPFVRAEMARISHVMELDGSIADLIVGHTILDPKYFSGFGADAGSLYGATRHLWQGGPFHTPLYNNPTTPWLWRVGASVHPGGGIPAVLGGAMTSVKRLLDSLR